MLAACGGGRWRRWRRNADAHIGPHLLRARSGDDDIDGKTPTQAVPQFRTAVPGQRPVIRSSSAGTYTRVDFDGGQGSKTARSRSMPIQAAR